MSADLLSLPARIARRRTTLSPRLAYGLVAAIVGLALFASGTPSPLYGTYRELWGFSPVVLTLVYATYSVAVLVMLLLAGRISDEVGRRPVLVVALSTLMASTVLFMVADSVAWLFAARAVQGLATGLALGAASAAMLDLHPTRHAPSVGFANGVVSQSGLGLGVLVSAAIVEVLPAPRVLPYAVLFGLFALALAGVVAMPEPVARSGRPRLTPQRPSVPSVVRRPFVLAALGVLSSWSIGGLYLSLGPQLAGEIFGTTDHLITGTGVFAMAGSGAVAQLLVRRVAPWRNASFGSLTLAAGLAVVVLSAAEGSGALFLIGGAIAGAGFGVAFLGALSALTAVIPPAPPLPGDVGVLRRGLRLAVAALGGRRRRRHPRRPRADVRDLRQRHRRPRPDRGVRGLAHAPGPRAWRARGRGAAPRDPRDRASAPRRSPARAPAVSGTSRRRLRVIPSGRGRGDPRRSPPWRPPRRTTGRRPRSRARGTGACWAGCAPVSHSSAASRPGGCAWRSCSGCSRAAWARSSTSPAGSSSPGRTPGKRRPAPAGWSCSPRSAPPSPGSHRSP